MEEEEIWEVAAAWIERDMDTTRRGIFLVLTGEEASERRKGLTVIWKERVGQNHPTFRLCTAEELACAVGPLEVTNQ